MKRKLINLILLSAIMTLSVGPYTAESFAQTSRVKPGKTGTALIYHGGPVMADNSNVYVIGYGDWPPDNSTGTMRILLEFISGLGFSEYFRINSLYADGSDRRPSGGLISGHHLYERTYSHGSDLKEEDIQAIVLDQLMAGNLPVDHSGLYVVVGAPDVSSEPTGFCQPNTAPHHGTLMMGTINIKYTFIGNPLQCPAIEAPQFVGPDGSLMPTPNGDFAADAMAPAIAHAFNVLVTNPQSTAWYDRYGFENADKCVGNFGETYHTADGAIANVRLANRDFLLQQNWINTPIGYCALSAEGLGRRNSGKTLHYFASAQVGTRGLLNYGLGH